MQWFWWLFDAIANLVRLCNDSDHQVQVYKQLKPWLYSCHVV